MITFKQKSFSEFDAMRSLYVELNKLAGPGKFQMIKLNSLLPILKGNNIVIERFVISTGAFKRDTYRMYLKIGARAKMPDEVRMPNRVYDETLLNTTLNVGFDSNSGDNNNQNQNNNQSGQKQYSNNGGGGKKEKPLTSLRAGFNFPVNITYEVKKLLGEAVNYDKKSRSLVLEFETIQDAIRAINILPFGVNYRIYLLDIDS